MVPLSPKLVAINIINILFCYTQYIYNFILSPYELYADTVNKSDPLYTVLQTVGQRVTGLRALLVVHIELWFVTELNLGYRLLTHNISEGTEENHNITYVRFEQFSHIQHVNYVA